MSDKIDIRDIVLDHYRTLVNANTGAASPWDYTFFLALPIALAWLFCHLGLELTREAVTALINAFAIFAGLLLNLLMLMRGPSRAPVGDGKGALRTKVLEQLYANLAYEILLTLLVLVLLLWMAIQESARDWVIARGVVFFLVSHFLLTLFMVLKRVHRLMSDELKPGQ